MSIALRYCPLDEAAKMLLEASLCETEEEARSAIRAAVRDRQLTPRFPEQPDLPSRTALADLMAFEVDWAASTLVVTTRDSWGRSWKSIYGGRRPVRIDLIRAEIEELVRQNAPRLGRSGRPLTDQTTAADVNRAKRIVEALAARGVRHRKDGVLDYCRRNGCAQLSKDAFEASVWATTAPESWKKNGRLSKTDSEKSAALLSLPPEKLPKINN